MKSAVALVLVCSCIYNQVVGPTVVDTIGDPPGIRDLAATVVPEWIQRNTDGEGDLVFVRRDAWEAQHREVNRGRRWMERADQIIDACVIAAAE